MWLFWIAALGAAFIDHSGVPLAQAGATIYLQASGASPSYYIYLLIVFCIGGYAWDVACFYAGRKVLPWFGDRAVITRTVHKLSSYPRVIAVFGRFIPGTGRYVGFAVCETGISALQLHILLIAGNVLFSALGIALGLLAGATVVNRVATSLPGVLRALAIGAIIVLLLKYVIKLYASRRRSLLGGGKSAGESADRWIVKHIQEHEE